MKNTWFLLSLVALFSISVMTVIVTYLIRKGLPPAFVLLFVVIIIGAVSISQLVINHSLPKSVSSSFWLLLVIAGVLSAIGNLAIYRATAISPNPGLAITILGLQGGIVSLIAVFALKDKLNAEQIFGILLGVLAVIVISLGSQKKQTDNAAISFKGTLKPQEVNQPHRTQT